MIVTHNMQQAARVADFTGFFLMGRLIEFDKTEVIFKNAGQEGDRRLHHGPFRLIREYWNACATFATELEQLKTSWSEMSGLVESSIHNAIYALVERNEQMAKEVMWTEARINQKEMEIDDLGHQPARPVPAHGARSALPHLGHQDQYRPGAHGRHGGEHHRAGAHAHEGAGDRPLIDIPKIAELAQGMVHNALDAFAERDADLARQVLRSDDEVDRLRDAVYHECWNSCRKTATPLAAPWN